MDLNQKAEKVKEAFNIAFFDELFLDSENLYFYDNDILDSNAFHFKLKDLTKDQIKSIIEYSEKEIEDINERIEKMKQLL